MKKSIVAIVVLTMMSSCVSLKNTFSYQDPYRYKKSKALAERTVKTNVNKSEEISSRIENKTPEFDIYKVEFTKTDEEILSRFKDEYNLIETETEIKRKTKDAIIQVRRKTNKNIKPLDFIIAVNETLKKTNTKSYIIAVSRTLNNWSR